MNVDWTGLLAGQLEFYWDVHFRPRLEGLTDDEYFWEPVAGCWTLRRTEDGRYALDGQWPEPDPPPVTTIAWRLLHIGIGCFATRYSTFFAADVPEGAAMFDPEVAPTDLPATAADAITFMDTHYRLWHDAIAGLDLEALTKPLGPKGAQYADEPMAALIIHINREVMHHGGEIALLRDLYRTLSPR